MADHEFGWPVLDRTAYLIEHACVPRAVPSYCAEEAQFFAALAACLRRNQPVSGSTNEPNPFESH